jgi:hypothetical protein
VAKPLRLLKAILPNTILGGLEHLLQEVLIQVRPMDVLPVKLMNLVRDFLD